MGTIVIDTITGKTIDTESEITSLRRQLHAAEHEIAWSQRETSEKLKQLQAENKLLHDRLADAEKTLEKKEELMRAQRQVIDQFLYGSKVLQEKGGGAHGKVP
jgi:predicted  nucleic acid-binding Zn-ribbon protein